MSRTTKEGASRWYLASESRSRYEALCILTDNQLVKVSGGPEPSGDRVSAQRVAERKVRYARRQPNVPTDAVVIGADCVTKIPQLNSHELLSLHKSAPAEAILATKAVLEQLAAVAQRDGSATYVIEGGVSFYQPNVGQFSTSETRKFTLSHAALVRLAGEGFVGYLRLIEQFTHQSPETALSGVPKIYTEPLLWSSDISQIDEMRWNPIGNEHNPLLRQQLDWGLWLMKTGIPPSRLSHPEKISTWISLAQDSHQLIHDHSQRLTPQ